MADRTAAIIGGGITGVLTARALLLAGWDVTVVEGAHLGAGSSSRTAAGIRQQFSTPGTVRGMRYSVAFYRDFHHETGGRRAIVQNGYLFLFDDDGAMDQARERVAMQRSVGLTEVEALDTTDLRERFPWVAPSMVGATWCPTDGFLRPDVVYSDGADRVRALGGRVVQKAPVTAAVFSGGRLTAVDTPAGRFNADLYIDCTNAWTARTGALLQGAPLEVAPLKRYLWFVDRGEGMPADVLSAMPLTIAPTGGYCRPENPSTLLMGKKHATPPQPDFAYADQDAIEPDFSHRGGIDAVPFELWMELADAIPALADFAGVNATTCGYYGTTPDHNPFLGFDPLQPNLIRLVGFSGHGAMFGPFTAAVAVGLAEAGRDIPAIEVDGAPVDLAAFRIGRSYDHSETMVI